MEEGTDNARNAEIGHEPRDLDPRRIALFGAGLAVVVIVAAGATLLLELYVAERAPAPPPAQVREATPEPLLQVNGAEELGRMRAEEDAALHSYGWVDRERGVVRIPIDAAMQALVKKGLRVRAEQVKRQK
ncbi:MAG TPA: hypothetical protein VGA73_13320 [Candidatus Binatia bacterium]